MHLDHVFDPSTDSHMSPLTPAPQEGKSTVIVALTPSPSLLFTLNALTKLALIRGTPSNSMSKDALSSDVSLQWPTRRAHRELSTYMGTPFPTETRTHRPFTGRGRSPQVPGFLAGRAPFSPASFRIAARPSELVGRTELLKSTRVKLRGSLSAFRGLFPPAVFRSWPPGPGLSTTWTMLC